MKNGNEKREYKGKAKRERGRRRIGRRRERKRNSEPSIKPKKGTPMKSPTFSYSALSLLTSSTMISTTPPMDPSDYH